MRSSATLERVNKILGPKVIRHTWGMDTADYQDLFRHLRKRPVAYGVPPGLIPAMVYLVACDESTERQLCQGFSEWIKAQRGDTGFDTYAFFREVISTAIGKERGEREYYWDLTGEDADLAHRVLFDSVDGFLSERQSETSDRQP